MRETVIRDPVAAYDRIAASYRQIAARRAPYLDGIDRLIRHFIPAGSRSLLDIGAGDGRRGLRLAAARDINTVVLLEPSAGMRAGHPRDLSSVESLPLRAEDLHQLEPGFDVIVCLWNVLGHVATRAARIEVLRQCGRLLTPRGRIFIDLSHRYNVRHYGLMKTAARYVGDHLWPRETRGDVVVAWHDGPEPIRTFGHVFSNSEVRGMFLAAGLAVERRLVVDYATGREHRHASQGHLLYVLRCPAAAAADVVTCPQAALA
jgi:2-polyprenyl-3-methyl-5-hydroxy-6-metoxy-1,4-benzoquinol methylase